VPGAAAAATAARLPALAATGADGAVSAAAEACEPAAAQQEGGSPAAIPVASRCAGSAHHAKWNLAAHLLVTTK
jgi:hypothetical protein